MTYAEKLRHPLWQKKRLHILNRDNWKCCSCGADDTNLQVHHLVYVRENCPWEYADDCYQTLCEKCHSIRQELTDKSVNSLRISLGAIPTQRLELVAKRLIASALEGIV